MQGYYFKIVPDVSHRIKAGTWTERVIGVNVVRQGHGQNAMHCATGGGGKTVERDVRTPIRTGCVSPGFPVNPPDGNRTNSLHLRLEHGVTTMDHNTQPHLRHRLDPADWQNSWPRVHTPSVIGTETG